MDYGLLWLGWGFLFCVIEGAAVLNKKRGDTLSEYVWKIFKIGVEPETTAEKWAIYARRLMLAVLMGLGTGHFFGVI